MARKDAGVLKRAGTDEAAKAKRVVALTKEETAQAKAAIAAEEKIQGILLHGASNIHKIQEKLAKQYRETKDIQLKDQNVVAILGRVEPEIRQVEQYIQNQEKYNHMREAALTANPNDVQGMVARWTFEAHGENSRVAAANFARVIKPKLDRIKSELDYAKKVLVKLEAESKKDLVDEKVIVNWVKANLTLMSQIDADVGTILSKFDKEKADLEEMRQLIQQMEADAKKEEAA